MARNLPPILDGEAAFSGVDLRTHPLKLNSGVLASSTNLRLTNGQPVPRGGVKFLCAPSGGTPYTSFFAGVFRPDTGSDCIILVHADGVRVVDADTGIATDVDLPTLEPALDPLAAPVSLCQYGTATSADGQMLISLGHSRKPLVLEQSGASWTLKVDSDIPWNTWAVYYQDRLAVCGRPGADTNPNPPQTISVSDFLSYGASGWQLTNVIQVMKGGDDYLVGASVYQQNKVILFGRRSVHLIYVDPTMLTSPQGNQSSLTMLSRQYGCLSRRTIVEIGDQIVFLSDGGVLAFTVNLDTQLIGAAEPLSAAISPLMAQLSANYASGACAVFHEERYYLAMPINGDPVQITSITDAGLVTTATPHGLAADDLVHITGLTQLTGGTGDAPNGTWTVETAPTSTTFTIDSTDGDNSICSRATAQRIEQRNNVIAVWNIVNGAWESIDELPGEIHADSLVVAGHGPKQRVFLVDNTYGPALFEEGTRDETGQLDGGILFDADGTITFSGTPTPVVTFSDETYTGTSVQAEGRTRTFSFGNPAQVRRVQGARARFSLTDGDAALVRVVARTPADELCTGSANVNAATTGEDTARLRLGVRASEAYIEWQTTNGTPVLQTCAVDTIQDTLATTKP